MTSYPCDGIRGCTNRVEHDGDMCRDCQQVAGDCVLDAMLELAGEVL